ncbi:MAG: HupE/UreJ family protein [Rhodospirillales bacterium]|nr:HupE/UreJ family protein [Rhodospirillales bacterium]
MRSLLLALALVLDLGIVPVARADVIPIAVLSVREVDAGVFVVRWLRAPSVSQETEAYAAYDLRFPEQCVLQPPKLACGASGLNGTIRFAGLDYKKPGVVLRVSWLSGITEILTLTTANPSVTFSGSAGSGQSWLRVARTYIDVGIEHILVGVDHLLFVFGLIWIVRSPAMLVKTISAFAVAYSVTLSAATLGWVEVPEAPVNAAIALSIVFIGVEVIKVYRGEGGLTARYPWVVAFAFGLLHGLGFAQALTRLGLPPDRIPVALLCFNVGVEIGQLGFVTLVLALMWAHRRLSACPPRWSQQIPAYLIGLLATFWCIDRVAMFWTATRAGVRIRRSNAP